MSWKKSKLSTPIPEEVAKLSDGLATVATTVIPILEVVTSLLEVAKAFIRNVVDPYKTLVDAILTELETFINDFFATGFYMLVVDPFQMRGAGSIPAALGATSAPTLAGAVVSDKKELERQEYEELIKYRRELKQLQIQQVNEKTQEGKKQIESQIKTLNNKHTRAEISFEQRRAIIKANLAMQGCDSFGIPKLTPRQAINAMISSLDDSGDPNRPVFSDNTEVVGLGILASAPGIDQFRELLDLLLQILQIPEFELMLYKLNETKKKGEGKSELPDWKSVRLNSFEPMKEIQDTVLDVIHMVKAFQITADQSIQQLINIIEKKIQLIEDLAKKLRRLSQELRSATGLFVMNMPPGIGGNTRIKQFCRDPILECSENQYTAAVLFVGGGPTLRVVDNIRQLMADK